MNEPRWADQDRGPNLQFSQFSSHIPLADLTSFLNEAIARVFKYLIPSTVGHALQQDIGQYPKGDIPQFHFYPSAIEILPSFAKTDAIVGEFGARPANKFPGLPGSRAATENPWPELGGKDLGDAEAGTFERLKLLHKKGYQLALLWPSEDKLPASTKFSNAVKNGIKKFNAWTPP